MKQSGRCGAGGHIEIERKFLVRDDSWRPLAAGVICRQGYLSSARERTVRVRAIGGEGYLTVKGIACGAARLEYEYEIPCEDACAMLAQLCEKPLIEKIRYRVPVAGSVWEIDEFLGANRGLVVAEIELESEGQAVEPPPWAGEEVTGDPRYFNSSLGRHPFSEW